MAANEVTGPSLTSSQVAPEQYVLAGGTTLLNAEAAAIWEQALVKARGQLANLLSDQNREALFADVFGRAGTDAATFAANLQVLLAALGGDGLQIAVDLRSDSELAGAFAAYAASGHTGSERIYVNADKLNNGLLDVNLATSALLEEFGHALDRRLNGGADSPGDEGQLFAAEVSGVALTADQRALIDAEDDSAVLMIEGVQVLVEMANLYWDGTGTSWNAVGSWGTAAGGSTDPAAVPGGSDVAYFSSLTTAQSVNLDANQAVTGLYFGAANTGTTVIQAGGTDRVLTLGAGGISIASGAGAVTIGSASSGQNVAITLGSAQSWTNDSTSPLTISNALNNGGYLLTSAGSGNTAIAGAISGSGAVTKSGAGTLTLSATNTFSGGLTMGANAGTVIAYTNAGTNVSALGSGAVAIGSGSTLELRSQNTGGNNTIINNTFTGTGLLKLSSSSTAGSNNFLGGINGFSGTVVLAYPGANKNILSGAIVSPWRSMLIDAPNATLQIDSGNTDYIGFYGSQTWKDIKVIGTGNAENFGAIRFDSNSTLSVSGSVSLLGDTTIGTGGGTLNGAITSGAAGTQTLTLGTPNATSGARLSGAIGGGTGAIALNKTQTGSVILSGANTYTGATTISAGTLQIGAGGITGSLSPSSNITNNGTLAFNRSNTITQGTDFNSVISGTGAVTQAGSGTLVLSGANTYTGTTTISFGTLNLTGTAGALTATSGVNISGGSLLLSGSAADRISNAASIALGAATDSKLQFSGNVTETLGALTLSSGVGKRVIDFGSGSGVLTLASLTAPSPLSVEIWNWSGTLANGGGTDQLIIYSGNLGGSLSTSNISFYSDSGTSLLSSAAMFNGTSSELVPDTIRPTISITDSDANTVNIADGTVTFTFTFSEAVTGFDTTKVMVGNGTKGTFSGSGTTYTLVVTPTASSVGNITVDVSTTGVTDAAGNQATAPAQYTQAFDTVAPTLAITTPISTDGFVNNAEDESSLIISGTSSGADGRTVTVAVGSITGQTATIAAGGAWSITLTSAQVKTLTEGTVNITANVSDTAGNPATQATASFVYDITAPTLAITTPISTDGFVNNAEDESSLIISGTSSGATGRTVTVAVGSITGQTATIATGGAWSITLTSAQVKTLTEGTVNITANVSDTAGNPATQATASFIYDRTAPTLAITTQISTDGYLNNAEDNSSLIISGTSSGADGRTVTVAVGGNNYTGTIATGGAWSITLTSAQLQNLTEGTINITANVSDTAGNPATQATASFVYDITAPTLLSSTPADGATDAGVSNNLVLNFSETIAAGSGLISLYRANGSLVESFDGATGIGSAGGSLAFSGSAVTINPFADLVRGSGYYLQLAATAVRDSAGNLYAGISDATSLNFTTTAVTLSVGSITVSESSLYAVVAVGLDAAISDNLSFTPTLLSGTASIGSDSGSTLQVFNGASWVSAAAGVSLAAGSTSLLLRVAINNDTTLEDLETFQISTGAITGAAAALTNASGASGTVTLADDGSSAQIFDQDTNSPAPLLRSTDNDTPSIAVSSVIVSEASPYAVLELSLTNPSNFAVSFTPSLQNGSASIGVDTGSSLEVLNGSTWQAAGQISLAAGVTSRLVRVAIANDSAYENSETFTISTGAISGLIANPAGASGTVTIRDNGSSSNTFLASNTSATPTAGSADNDTPALPALSAAVLGNGNESGPLATSFRISRTGSTSSAMVATYRFAGSAIAGSDYTNPAGFDASTGLGSVTIAAGQSSVDLNVASLDDSAVDGNRSLSLTLQSSLNYSLAAATATATILDNDVAPPLTPTFAISSASVVETDSGTNPLVNLIVSLSAPNSTSVSVRVRTLAALSGTSATGTSASGGGDYVAISDQLLTFLPGSTSQQLPIQLLGDNTIEATESFRIELFNASGANLPAAAATIEIVDNDTAKSLTINNSAATTPKTFSGGQYADILIGGSGADTINGDPAGQIGGGDAITGNGGADILTGGPGADRFRYSVFSDSTFSSTDRIRDLTLTGNDQDRIALAALPSALWNTGAITPTSATLASAVTAAFADKDGLTAGNQALAAGEAVLFAYDSTPGNALTRQWFVAVNDSSAAFSSSSDLLINVTGLKSSFASGSLTTGLLFATL